MYGFIHDATIITTGVRRAFFPLVVKWYNSRLITGHYKFDSCREDQIFKRRSVMTSDKSGKMMGV